MTEFVLVMPLLMLVLALLFYFGSLAVRVQQSNALARYEVWRSAMDAHGPATAADGEGNALRAAFFPGESGSVQRSFSAADFPEAAYQRLLAAAEAESADAGRLAWTWIHEPDGEDRLDRGLGQQFEVHHDRATRSWDRIGAFVGRDENPERSPLRRGQVRIRGDWPYVDDWRAAWPQWRADLDGPTAPVEATRDAFFESFDQLLESEAKGQARRSGREVDHTLTGLMRTFYLHTPRYRGPTVVDD